MAHPMQHYGERNQLPTNDWVKKDLAGNFEPSTKEGRDKLMRVLWAYADGDLVVKGDIVCQHQFLPWLRLPNGSDWTECIECGKAYQYDH